MEDMRKLAWVKWSKCCVAKDKGGLGIKDIGAFNIALVGKWLWRLFCEKESLWVKVIEAKYGRCEDWLNNRGSIKGSIWWKDLMVVCDVNNSGGWWRRRVKRKVGCGADVKFWWLGFGSLKENHNRLFCNSAQQEEPIINMGRWVEGEWKWEFRWRRLWFEWEKDLLTTFLQVLENVKIDPNSSDTWVWTADPENIFTVKSAYEELVVNGPTDESSAMKLVWLKLVPSKVNVLAWRIILDRVQTRDKLKNCNIISQRGNVRCVLCEDEEENKNHLFFSCPVAYNIWSLCYTWVGFESVFPLEAS